MEQLLVESNAAAACTKSLLTALLTGRVEPPEIEYFELPTPVAVVPPAPDMEQVRLKQRLNAAAEILRQKRSRTH